MKLITRKEAQEQSLTHYYTGKPCKRNHISLRFTNTGNCVECGLVHAANKRHSDVDAHRALKAKEYARNRETILEQQSTYRKANWKAIYEKRKNNPEYQQYMRQYLSTYIPSDDTKAVLAACVRHRQLSKLNRTPLWLSKSDRTQIAELYKLARRLTKETGIKHVVDHIIPLQGKLVSGLHVLSNLQVITWDENRIKSNTFDPDQSTSP